MASIVIPKLSSPLGECRPKETKIQKKEVMPKTQPLCTSAKSNLRDEVLGEVEKNSFIALPGKGGHSGLMPSELCPRELPGSPVVRTWRFHCSRPRFSPWSGEL